MTAEWYGEGYLWSDHWRALRRQVKKVRGRLCAGCKKARHKVVHHKTYERLGAESLEDLELLCQECHKTLHVGLLRRGVEIPGIGVIRQQQPPVSLVPLFPLRYMRKVLKRGSW